jgi:hypothetical protein
MTKRIFRIEIECENQAFDESPGTEVARILHHIATQVLDDDFRDAPSGEKIRDNNGNLVGYWHITGA